MTDDAGHPATETGPFLQVGDEDDDEIGIEIEDPTAGGDGDGEDDRATGTEDADGDAGGGAGGDADADTGTDAGVGGDNETGTDTDTDTGTGTGADGGPEAGNETGTGGPEAGAGGGAGDGGGGGGISATQGPRDDEDLGFDTHQYVEDSMEAISDELTSAMGDLLETMVVLIVGTPAPNSIWGAPTNEPWATAYEYYQGEMIPLALLLLVAVVAAITLAGTMSGILSSYQTSQLWYRAMFALLFVFFWWPAGAMVLQFEHWLATLIAPSGEDFAESIEGVLAGITGAATVVAMLKFVATAKIIAIAMMYGMRYVVIVAMMVVMVILVMLWVVDASVFRRVSNLSSGLMSVFVPVVFLTLPAAALMRVGLIIFVAGANAAWISGGVMVVLGLGTLLASLVVPIYTFNIARQFMAASFGAEQIGNALDRQYAARKQQVQSWYSGDPDEPAASPDSRPQIGGLQASNAGPAVSDGGADTTSGPTSRPRLSPKSNPSGAGATGATASAATATGSTTAATSKYANQQRPNNYRIESRRRELQDDFTTTGFD